MSVSFKNIEYNIYLPLYVCLNIIYALEQLKGC
jgi:hypothetical protein